MPLLAIPNISTGASGEALRTTTEAVSRSGARLLDVHSDEVHNRSVLTTTAADAELIGAMVALAQACRVIDLSVHRGVHPRVGALDVCPFVPHNDSMDAAIAAAHEAGRTIADELNAPVFFYGAASTRPETKELPDIRRGGIVGLMQRMKEGFAPDAGPPELDPRYGAVMVGARGVLIAFNVWVMTDLPTARSIAAEVRERGVVRTLGLQMSEGRCQISMNLIAPERLSIEGAFARVERSAWRTQARILATEIVGLVEERFLPPSDAKVTRLLIEPGHSLESALSG